MPQGTKKSVGKSKLDERSNRPRPAPKVQRKASLQIAVKKSNLQHSNKAKNHLSKVIHKNIEQQMIAKCEADKPGILRIAKATTLKKSEQIDQRKTLEKQMKAAGSSELKR